MPQDEDPRAQYKLSPASFGQVLPLVYGTTMIPTPSLSRGRLVVNGSTWQQYQVVLGLCQGPISEVKSMWVSNGSEGDAGDAAQRIEWIRMTDAGASLQTGTINGHTGT